ncbi:ABC transporter permease [Leptolyngbya sp. FACHB-17]|uniref:ABC transporter permease n=1 Tax=unclassified Leptolyngbya TaxID=2650499 RepID=UPI00167FEC6B|nr:ABC transporter permease [Leptolyngbya sp. FACHB-17]MBD2081283.1 ABC transporter permease [Leptolyngbya sp. FACHB-17]
MTTLHRTSFPRLRQRIDVLRQLVDRDMKLLYKRSALGVAWTLISPLLQLIVFAFVFQVVLPSGVPRYASFTFTGLLVWNWFQSSLFQATAVIISNRSLIRQPGFPSAILPIVTTTTGLIHFLLALPILLGFLLFDGIELKPVVLLLPVLQMLQFALIVCCAYFLAALNVTFRDVQHTLGVVLMLLFYVTPVFYDLKNLPAQYQLFYNLNPMVHLVRAYRAILMQGTLPDVQSLLTLALIVGISLPVGLFVFRCQSDRFVEAL